MTPTQPVASPPAASTSACRDRAGFVSDVTVRDNAELAPGQPFVKIWRLANTGTCTWTPDYALVFFGGDRMAAAATVPLSATIGPGLEVDLPVDLTAPEHPGTYQGFWRLRNPAGALFGIGPAGDQSFWVKIIVVALPTPSVTPSATMTATPDIVATGTLEYPPASSFDLDSGQPDSSDRADVTLSGISLEDGALSPSSGARIAPYAPPPAVPGPVDCWSATLGDQALPAAGLSAGSLICYVTGLGRPCYFEVLQVDDALTLRFTTWNP